jgi:hypothetical protein
MTANDVQAVIPAVLYDEVGEKRILLRADADNGDMSIAVADFVTKFTDQTMTYASLSSATTDPSWLSVFQAWRTAGYIV